MKVKVIIIIVGFLLLTFSCYKEDVLPIPSPNKDETLIIDNIFCAFNNNTNTFFYPLAKDSINNFNPVIEYYFNELLLQFDNQILYNESQNNLGDVKINKNYSLTTIHNGQTINNYNLLFTLLPVIEIFTEEEIVDEPKTNSFLRINDPYFSNNGNFIQQYETYAGIEIRGGVSTHYPKVSYSIELWVDLNSRTSDDFPLLGLRDDDDWILDAMYIDKARMRNIVSFELWEAITEHEKENITDEISSIHGKYIELFINNNYQGIYSLNEKIDRKQLNLDVNYNGFGGLLYKAVQWDIGAVTFIGYSDITKTDRWEGWQQEYPEPENHIQWEPLYDFIKFVVESDDMEFKEQVNNYIDLNNFLNYYIFLNIISGFDNVGKNTFLYKKTNTSKFRIAPWDMDGTWGRNWDSTYVGTHHHFTNNLFDRLIETDAGSTKHKLKQKWISLRSDIISKQSLLDYFRENSNLFSQSQCIERENQKWDSNININRELEYIENWINERIDYLDAYFSEFLIP